jgi:lipopolysaccharide biosynthesis regulator YciM
MEGRKLALMLCVAASCAGCVSESKSVEVPPEQLANLRGVTIKPEEPYKGEARPQTWVAFGQFKEGQSRDDKLGVAQQNVLRDEARKAYQKALDLDPKCVEAHVALANFYLNQDDCDHALGAYQRGLQQNPKSQALWFQAGMCYGRNKDFPHALDCVARAHELEPQNHEIATTYGLLLARVGRSQDAVNVMTKVMNRTEANLYVARMMEHLNQHEQARQYVQAALQERPTHPGALQLLTQLDSRPHLEAPPALANEYTDPAVQPAAYRQ